MLFLFSVHQAYCLSLSFLSPIDWTLAIPLSLSVPPLWIHSLQNHSWGSTPYRGWDEDLRFRSAMVLSIMRFMCKSDSLSFSEWIKMRRSQMKVFVPGENMLVCCLWGRGPLCWERGGGAGFFFLVYRGGGGVAYTFSLFIGWRIFTHDWKPFLMAL